MTVRPLDPPRKWNAAPPSGRCGRASGLAAGVADEPRIDFGCAAKRRALAASPGPLKIRSASGIFRFDGRAQMANDRAPTQRLVDIAEVGRVVAFLVGGALFAMPGDTI